MVLFKVFAYLKHHEKLSSDLAVGPMQTNKIWSAKPISLALSKGPEKSQPRKWSEPKGLEAIWAHLDKVGTTCNNWET